MTGEKLGGGALHTARTFDAKTGRVSTLRSTTTLGSERQDVGYTWDVLGNLTKRTDTTGNRNLTETFTYDTLYGGNGRKRGQVAQCTYPVLSGTYSVPSLRTQRSLFSAVISPMRDTGQPILPS